MLFSMYCPVYFTYGAPASASPKYDDIFKVVPACIDWRLAISSRQLSDLSKPGCPLNSPKNLTMDGMAGNINVNPSHCGLDSPQCDKSNNPKTREERHEICRRY